MAHVNNFSSVSSEAPPRILVVDDEEGIRSAMVSLLKQKGYSADSAEDGPAALRAAQEHAPDVVVTDLMMPGMDGVELLRQLKRQNSETLVIVVTSLSDVGEAVSAMRAGAEDYLSKPIDFEALALTVERALEQRRSRIEVASMRDRISAQQARLSRLYEISKLLTRFETITHTLPEVLSLLNDSVPLRTAVLMVERAEECTTRAIAWLAEDVSSSELSEARAHANRVYTYLSRKACRVDEEIGAQRLPSSIPPSRETPRRGFIFLPLVVEHEQMFGGLQVEAAGCLDEADLAFVNAVVNQLAIALHRDAAIEAKLAADRAGLRAAEFLAGASATIFSSLEYESTIAAVLRAMVPALADVCLLDRVTEDGGLQRLTLELVSGSDDARSVRRFAAPSGAETPQAQALRSGEAFVITNQRASIQPMGELEFSGLMVVPLIARGRGLGVLTFVATESGRQYSVSDLALAREIGHRAAIAIDNAQLHEQAQRAIAARQDLMASVSHDLKSPLGSILMASNFLVRAASTDAEARVKHCAVIERSAQRMNRLLGDLLDIASIEAGRLAMEMQPHLVAPLICEAVDMNEALAGRNELSIHGLVCPEILEIECDRDRLLQVFGNLIGNAIKFTAKGGAIRVAAQRGSGEVLFSVADSGRGIESSELVHVFDRFWQARRTAHLGTGLGLAITKALVEAHRGRIWAESTLGEGTTFFFTIPLAARAAGDAHSELPFTERRAIA